MQDAISVRIVSPEKVVWEGKATSVSSVNQAGPFDILAQHANFITYVVEKQPIKVRSDGKEIPFVFDRSVIYTRQNTVLIYCNL